MYQSFRLLLIFVVFMVKMLPVLAQERDFEQHLSELRKTSDKSTVIAQLEHLLASSTLTPEQVFSTHVAIIFTYHELNDLDKALAQAQAALEFSSASSLGKEIATAHKMIGAMHYYRGENNAAVEAYERALKIFKTMDLPVSQANLYNNLALVYTTTGEIGKASIAYQTAQPLYQEFGSEEDRLDIRYNIAGLHIRMKRYDTAITLLHEVIEKRLQMGDDEDLAGAYADIGVAYKMARQFQHAEHYMNKAMDYYLGQKNFYMVTSQYQNLSDLYNMSGEYDKAYEYALKTVELSQKVSHKKAFVGGLYTHAMSLFQQGQLDHAIDKLTLSTQKGQEIHYKPQVIENLGLIALAYAGKQEFTKSLQAFREYLHEKNKQMNAEFDQQLAQFEVQQLTHQVQELEQQKKLQLLEQEQQQQAWKNVVFVSIVSIFLIFFLYRRHAYNRLRRELEIKVKQRTEALEIANKKLTELSFIDGMTSIYNRRSFDVDMLEVWQRQYEQKKSFLLVITSVDEFNQFNSSYGHSAADDLLKKIATLIKVNLARQDKVYRITGSEFAIICKDSDLPETTAMIEYILSEVAALKITHHESEHKVVTMSAGICQSDDNIQSIEQLIDRADQRLYIAKKTGRNKLVNQVIKPA